LYFWDYFWVIWGIYVLFGAFFVLLGGIFVFFGGKKVGQFLGGFLYFLRAFLI